MKKLLLIGSLLLLSGNVVFSGEDFESLIKKADLYQSKREDRENVRKAIELYKEALQKNSESYEANWKLARAYFNFGDLLPEDREDSPIIKSKIGEEGMRYGKRAIEINPDGIEGNFFYALNIGLYCHSIGHNLSVFRAIREGVRVLYVKHLKRVLDEDPGYLFGSPLVAYGRYFHRVPYPNHLKKAERYLKEAIKLYPENLRARRYLGEVYIDMKKVELAEEQFQFVISQPGIPQMRAEDKKEREIAKRHLKALKRRLKLSSYPEEN
ncbi:MAG TPA: tetratricopeptide repeat protein [Candidatus Omnitrophica bacterium]|nr:tetratricopeptide repeat protein [Candidatus Omnitrophota bacterium]